eukprot:366187-Chlamydomonas_euryale.AAC.8
MACAGRSSQTTCSWSGRRRLPGQTQRTGGSSRRIFATRMTLAWRTEVRWTRQVDTGGLILMLYRLNQRPGQVDNGGRD